MSVFYLRCVVLRLQVTAVRLKTTISTSKLVKTGDLGVL